MTASARRFLLLLVSSLLIPAAVAAVPYLVDGDGDAVSDEIDDCPYTAPGIQVDRKGCAIQRDDGDIDGVPDVEDDCPYTVAKADVDPKGCALDSDFDGVANGPDRCPSTPLAVPVDSKGCAAGDVVQTAAAARASRKAEPAPRRETVARTAASPQSSQDLAPLIASRPAAATPAPLLASAPTAAGAVVAETPAMTLQFSANSDRLSDSDLATIAGYARVFQRQLAASPSAVLRLMAYADSREKQASAIAGTRAQVVRAALLARGLPAARVIASDGIIQGGDAVRNRRLEAAVRD